MANTPKTTGAKRGKIKGQAKVTLVSDANQSPPEKPEDLPRELAPPVKPDEGPHDIEAARQAGLLASQRGTPNRPPLGYSNAEVKAWYAGYKSHANPNAKGRVEGVEQGYRKDY